MISIPKTLIIAKELGIAVNIDLKGNSSEDKGNNGRVVMVTIAFDRRP